MSIVLMGDSNAGRSSIVQVIFEKTLPHYTNLLK